MAMTRQERIGLHKKQERLQVKKGVPNLKDLDDGVPALRLTSEGVVQYIRYNNALYKNVFLRQIDDVYNVDETVNALSTGKTNQSPDYDSGWFLVAVNSTYDKEFGWTVTADTLPSIVKILWSDDATPVVGADEIWEVQTGHYFYDENSAGCFIEYKNSTEIRLHTGEDHTFMGYDILEDTTSTAGYYKLQVWK